MSGLRTKSLRNERGAAVIALTIALFFFMLVAGLFTFESCEAQMIQRQVVAICDAAALTGTAMLTSSDIANDTPPSYPLLTSAQQNAATYAQNMIVMSSILGQPLTNATNVGSVSSIGTGIQAGACQYVISLADPTNNYASVAAGNTAGKSISCFMGYGYSPSLLAAMGINTTILISGSSYGGLPQVDAVLVFDYSASMDDQTVVTFVRREWIHDTVNGAVVGKMGTVTAATPGAGIIQYLALTSPTVPPTIADYLGWDYSSAAGAQGSAANALPPQNLQATSNDPNGCITHNMNMDLYLRSHYAVGNSTYSLGSYANFPPAFTNAYRAYDYGTPPGNCDLAENLGGNGDGLTNGTGVASPPFLPWAFSDLTWQADGGTTYNFEPAAPGARTGTGTASAPGTAVNDTYPSSDQQTYTDLVVNIGNPSTSGPTGSGTTTYPYEQPLNGPNTFAGFSFTFSASEPDAMLAGVAFNFANLGVLVEASRGNLEATGASGLTDNQSANGCGYRALLDRKYSINGTVQSTKMYGAGATITGTINGYQKAYSRLAMMFSQPIATAMLGADQGFYQKLHLLADSCFGLVGFSSRGPFDNTYSSSTGYFATVGTNDDQALTPTCGSSFYTCYPPYGNLLMSNYTFFLGYPTNGIWTTAGNAFTWSKVNTNYNSGTVTYTSNYQIGGNGCNFQYVMGSASPSTTYGFRVPRTQLAVTSPVSTDPDQYLACTSQSPTGNSWSYLGTGANGIYNGRPESLTDTSEALTTARLMFHSTLYNMNSSSATLSRPASRKIIIFFTDGEPTSGVNGSEALATQAIAGTGAGTCAGDGIAIYTIGLNVSNNSTLTSDQLTFLGTSGNGLAALAGNSGQFFPCTSGQDVINAFSAVARRLAQGQR